MSSRRRNLALGCALVVLLPPLSCLLTAALQPSGFRIARARDVTAPIASVREVATDVERFERSLSRGARPGPPPAISFSSERTGEGAFFDAVFADGRTRFTLVEVADERIVYEVSTAGDMASGRSRYVIELSPIDARHTRVTQAMEGELDTFTKRALWPFVGLENRVAPELEASLVGLEREAR